MYLLLFILFLKLMASDIVPPLASQVNPQEIPIISESKHTCPCSRERKNLCRGGIYVDYYYNAPYSGYPKDEAYLPPSDSVPVIIEKLTLIRDGVKEFVIGANAQESPAQKALYVKTNFAKVKFLLQAIDKAAKKAKAADEKMPE